MSQSEQAPITFRVATYVGAGVMSAISFLMWMDARVDNRISERIAPLELRLSAIEGTMNMSNASRRQEYGELRDLLREIRDARED